MDGTEYTERRPGPGHPERWSYHWWRMDAREGLYQACRTWGFVVRWRRSARSRGAVWPTCHRENDEVWVEVDGRRTRVMAKYLPSGSTKAREPLPAIAYAYLDVERLVIEVAGEEAAVVLRRCLARQFADGSGRAVRAEDPEWVKALVWEFVRRGTRRFA
ncbi:MAG: hypothetical protein KIS66_02510 [Fimbriimonadaceae bacterium]|nr:hypothetical protein [Fimbriimonadaceae bacterium]